MRTRCPKCRHQFTVKQKRSKSPDPPTLTPASARQLEIIQYVDAFIRIRGYSPRLQDISIHFGISKASVYEHVDNLVGRGLVTRGPKYGRSELVVVAEAVFPRLIELPGNGK